MSRTKSYKVSEEQESIIRDKLENIGFEFTDNQDAFWRAFKADCVAIFYRSGKLVIQGADVKATADFLFPKKPNRQRKLDL